MGSRWFVAVLVGAALLGACGDDEAKKTEDAGMDAGNTGGKGGNGGGGTGGTTPESIMCGSTECAQPMLTLPDGGFEIPGIGPVSPALIEMFGIGPENCCAGASGDLCGVTQSMLIMDGTCLERDQPGRAAAEGECPSGEASIMGFALPLAGCCRPDNKCGVQLDLLGVGCLENSEFTKIQGMGGGTMGVDASVPMLDAKSCVYELPTDDAGADAGH